MKKQLFILIFYLFVQIFETASANSSIYVIKFTDKNNSPFNINLPLEFLSQRAIDRRVNQGIALSIEDFPVNESYVNQIEALGVQILNRSRWLNAVSVYCTDSLVIQNIQSLAFVQSVEAVKRPSPSITPIKFESDNNFTASSKFKVKNNDSEYRYTPDYGNSFGQVSMLGGDLLHFAGFMGNGKVIAVIDAGFLIADLCDTFDSLFINNQILGTWDFVSGDANVYDDHYHGTYVLSTIAGNSPGELIGTAPKAKFWLLRSEDAPTEYIVEEFNWVCAAEFADSVGADIINSSLGYTTFDNPLQNHTYADLDGATAMASIGAATAASKGIVVCNSAGNNGNDAWGRIAVPADADNILTVGAVDSLEIRADFSSRGYSIDGRIKPDVAAQGVHTVGQHQPGIFVVGNGTSFSSPLIAGMCASFWEAVPNLTAAEVIQKVKESCDQYSNPDSLKGYGIPNFAQAYFLVTGDNISYPPSSKIDFVGPNPFNDFINVRYYAADTQHIEIRIFDLMGIEVAYKKQYCEPKSFITVHFPMPNRLAAGLYIMEIKSKYEKRVFRIVRD
ncbi:MAG TPA: S8 family serine peptidase [Bacteroidia bacterium]|nr:S8 family serine peptidase [Bacteroidia bacterium]